MNKRGIFGRGEDDWESRKCGVLLLLGWEVCCIDYGFLGF